MFFCLRAVCIVGTVHEQSLDAQQNLFSSVLVSLRTFDRTMHGVVMVSLHAGLAAEEPPAQFDQTQTLQNVEGLN